MPEGRPGEGIRIGGGAREWTTAPSFSQRAGGEGRGGRGAALRGGVDAAIDGPRRRAARANEGAAADGVPLARGY